jgi:hypothetical protein
MAGNDVKTGLEPLLSEIRRHTDLMQADLDQVQRVGRELTRELQLLGQQQELMTNLYVQLQRLHCSLRLPDVVVAIEETLTNLVGTEDFAVLVHDHDTGRYERLMSVGEGSSVEGFALGEGVLGLVAQSGRLQVGRPLAAVPLASGLRPGCIGMIVITRLLRHKAELSARDRPLLEVFAAHAGVALEAAMCAAAAGARPCRVAELRALLDGAPSLPPLAPEKGALRDEA